MSEENDRPMTLSEYMEQLPHFHPAYKEWVELNTRSAKPLTVEQLDETLEALQDIIDFQKSITSELLRMLDKTYKKHCECGDCQRIKQIKEIFQ